MDFGQFVAALTFFSIVAFGIVDRIKAARPTLTPGQIVLISIPVSLAVPFIIAYSSFGDQIAIGNLHLNDVNGLGLLALGLLSLGGTSVLHQLVGSGGSGGSGGAIANIGENQEKAA